MPKTIDDYIEERNAIQLKAEPLGDKEANKCWAELGVANRHITRVLDGMFELGDVEKEIEACFHRVRKMYERPASNP